jgi:two-component system sensor histidine kinase DctS
MPRVVCDRTMVEQVLLNLSRNGIQAMEAGTPAPQRLLRIAARPAEGAAGARVCIEVHDTGPGIPAEVAARLFTPFFTTRAEGMGLGLSLCRTVVEQHGGRLTFAAGGGGRGTVFSFTLPAPRGEPGGVDAAAGEGQRGADHCDETGETRSPAG